MRVARENPGWGYDRIQGALANLGYDLSDTSVGNILKAHGIEPAPRRKRTTTWKTFLRAHWDVLAAVDFTTIEVWGLKGLVTMYLLFVMEVATRRAHFAGCTASPEEAWLKQVARNLTAADDGFLQGKQCIPNPGFGSSCRKSGRLDSNQRPLGPEPSALAKLSYAPSPSEILCHPATGLLSVLAWQKPQLQTDLVVEDLWTKPKDPIYLRHIDQQQVNLIMGVEALPAPQVYSHCPL